MGVAMVMIGGHIFREGRTLRVAVTLIVCSNDIPKAGFMDANHKGCDGCKALSCCYVISSPSQVCYFCAVSLLVGHTAIVN